MDATMAPRVIGYDRRRLTLPLKATGITFVDSRLCPQVQLADVIAGAFATVLANPLADPELSVVVQRTRPVRAEYYLADSRRRIPRPRADHER
ncbi:MAG TPA: DUF3800 domain-containing protein [Terriglobales bacterium]|nr:DUF3800 domain-containing protein [Terriglobales bacterium]